MAILTPARIASPRNGAGAMPLVLVLALSSACENFRQHSDLWTDGGASAGGIDGQGGASGGGAGGSGGAVKKPDGEPCAAASECTTGVCGGRCCAAGCTCTLPGSANLIQDPGIDLGVTNWTTSTGTISRSLHDAEQCPFSGSLAATGDAAQVIAQCLRSTPLVGDFTFGVRYMFESAGAPPAKPICQVIFYSGFNCDADISFTAETDQTAGGVWESISGEANGLTGANSAALNCYLHPSGGVTYYLDMFYLSKTPARF
jgi:hypothetical protein